MKVAIHIRREGGRSEGGLVGSSFRYWTKYITGTTQIIAINPAKFNGPGIKVLRPRLYLILY
jgi:hypothetical protein